MTEHLHRKGERDRETQGHRPPTQRLGRRGTRPAARGAGGVTGGPVGKETSDRSDFQRLRLAIAGGWLTSQEGDILIVIFSQQAAQQKRDVMTKPQALVWMTQVVFVAFLATSIRADETDDNIKKINDELIDAQIAAHEKALASIRELRSVLVDSDDEREEHVRNWKTELDIRLNSLRDQKGMDPRVLKELEKEFESVGRDDWWWLNKANPGQKEKWYRLNAGKNRWENMFYDASRKPQVCPEYTATYEILGLDKADQDVILVKMVFPPKGAGPGDSMVLPFNRKTGVIDSPWGWYAEPKKKKKLP